MSIRRKNRQQLIAISASIAALMSLNVIAQGNGTQLASVQERVTPRRVAAQIYPPARSGECYAKVKVPARYREEDVKVLVKEASAEYAITPAAFQNTTRRVAIRDPYNKITVVPPETTVVQDNFAVSAASSLWVRDSVDGRIPVSDGDRRDLNLSGINMDSIAVGSCLYEHYKPAVVKKVPARVLVSEATEKLDVVPVQFRQSLERVVVKPQHKKLLPLPAEFTTVEEQIVVEPKKSIWKVGTGPIQRIDNLTGDIMCRVDVPPVYETRAKQVIKTPARVTSVVEDARHIELNVEKLVSDSKEVRTPVPAVYETMHKEQVEQPGVYSWLETRQAKDDAIQATGRAVCHKPVESATVAFNKTIVTQPGRFERERVEAKFEDVKIASMTRDATTVRTVVPAVTETLKRRIQVQEERYEWMSVLCETNTTGDIVSRLQQALKTAGYPVGPVDGLLGNGTLAALKQFQQKNNLAEGGVTMESMKALGVKL